MKSLNRPLVATMATLLFGLVLSDASAAETVARNRPRVVATTDGEIDDRCSMVRFLMYANEWDIEGLVYSSSKHHWKGDRKTPGKTWAGETWIQDQINLYAKAFPTLKTHDPDYPTPEYLKRHVYVGNIVVEGDMRGPTPGSDRIAEVLLDDDPSPVWLQAWGGANTIAQALKTIEQKHPDRKAYVSQKAKIYLISMQDQTYPNYIAKRWPKVETLYSTAFGAIAYRWRDIMEPGRQTYFDSRWMIRNILKGHGPLCAVYEAHRDGSFRSEGDSPAFMHLINVGLGSEIDPGYGGWGGRFAREKENYWRSAPDDRDRYQPILRFAVAFQNDWAARADWCVKPYDQCNHAPTAVCNADRTRKVLEISADPNDRVKLSAAGSKDPDGDRLAYKWWIYKDAGTYWDDAPIRDADTAAAVVTVPQNASGRTIHVILEITDNGSPPLTAYRRCIIAVSGDPQDVPPDAGTDLLYLNAPITNLSGPPADTGNWTFYRGVNLNGSVIRIDGNQWEGDNAPNFKCADRALNRPDLPLRPKTDNARAKMIHSFRWNSKASLAMTKVPRGTYAVYLYVWEETEPETFSIFVEGELAARRYYSGVKGEWHRLGPWMRKISDGSIDVTTSGGAANISGIEVWRKSS